MSGENGNGTPAIVFQAERDVIQGLLGAPERICEVADRVSPDDFLDPTHRLVFRAMVALDMRRDVVDATNLHTETKKRVPLSWFAEQSAYPPNTAFLTHHARRLCTIARGRELGVAMSEVGAMALQEPWGEDLFERAEAALFSIGSRTKALSSDLVGPDLKARSDRLWDEKSRGRGIPCGLADIDNLLDGLEKGALIVIGARPSAGKSTLALGMAFNIARAGGRAAFFSLEMDREVVIDRLISVASGVPLMDMRSNKMSTAQRHRAAEAVAEIESIQLYVNATPGISPMAVRSEVRRLSRRAPLDAVFVDYLQEMTPLEGDNRTEKVGSISRGLKHVAREFSVPLIAPAQLSRKTEDRSKEPPTLSDLRESGSIEQDADVVLFIHRPNYTPNPTLSEVVEIHCGKNRNGPKGKVNLLFQHEAARFVDYSQGEPI